MMAALAASASIHASALLALQSGCPDCSRAARPKHNTPLSLQLARKSTVGTNQVVGIDLPPWGKTESASSNIQHIDEIARENSSKEAVGDDSQSPALLQPFTYYKTQDLDKKPYPIAPIDPNFPLSSDAMLTVVVLRLFIADDGSVARIESVSTAADERYTNSAVSAFQAAKFVPGVKAGANVNTQMLVEVVFDPAAQNTAEQKSTP